MVLSGAHLTLNYSGNRFSLDRSTTSRPTATNATEKPNLSTDPLIRGVPPPLGGHVSSTISGGRITVTFGSGRLDPWGRFRTERGWSTYRYSAYVVDGRTSCQLVVTPYRIGSIWSNP